jgi:hypothetical protein
MHMNQYVLVLSFIHLLCVMEAVFFKQNIKILSRKNSYRYGSQKHNYIYVTYKVLVYV